MSVASIIQGIALVIAILGMTALRTAASDVDGHWECSRGPGLRA